MRELTAENASEYLAAGDRVSPGEPIAVRELPGGVSNVVLLVELPRHGQRGVAGGGLRFVLKQARGRLRVKEEWLCPVERIWREVEVLRICGEQLEARNKERIAVSVPEILWEDRENFCFAMTAAPEGQRTWKELLFAGEMELNRELAVAAGRLLGELHGGTWNNAAVAMQLADRSYFDRLRIDPYYRQIGRVHGDLTADVERLIDSVWQNRLAL